MISNRQPENEDDILSEFAFTYTRQIIIDFVHSNIAMVLRNRWLKNHSANTCIIIDGHSFIAGKYNREDIISKDKHTRIYLVAHGSSAIADNKGEQIDTKKLAQALVDLIGDYKLMVNLLACGVGRDIHSPNPLDNPHKSYASKLHRTLVKLAKKDIPVIARRHIITTKRFSTTPKIHTFDLDKPWSTHSFSLYLGNLSDKHKQLGSKAIFCLDKNNEEVVIDVYFAFWKNRVLKKLKKILHTEQNEQRREKIKEWLDAFPTLHPEKIYEIINEELRKTFTLFKDIRKNALLMYARPTKSFVTLEKLLIQRERMYTDKYTVREPTKVLKKD